jgi:RND superfamily putative drug exporter
MLTAFLSLITSFGILVMTLQDGIDMSGTLDPLQLIFIFTVSFGLSLDYEMFMLSRVQEVWIKEHNHISAVATGIERTAKTISFAGFSLCIVLIAFMTSKVILLKCIGVVGSLLIQHNSICFMFCFLRVLPSQLLWM